eukprot:m.255735 g.255735  ORF g.255735 m.255735 type:complete len:308 (+) comp19687_c0_seq1:5487-6410(+)
MCRRRTRSWLRSSSAPSRSSATSAQTAATASERAICRTRSAACRTICAASSPCVRTPCRPPQTWATRPATRTRSRRWRHSQPSVRPMPRPPATHSRVSCSDCATMWRRITCREESWHALVVWRTRHLLPGPPTWMRCGGTSSCCASWLRKREVPHAPRTTQPGRQCRSHTPHTPLPRCLQISPRTHPPLRAPPPRTAPWSPAMARMPWPATARPGPPICRQPGQRHRPALARTLSLTSLPPRLSSVAPRRARSSCWLASGPTSIAAAPCPRSECAMVYLYICRELVQILLSSHKTFLDCLLLLLFYA